MQFLRSFAKVICWTLLCTFGFFMLLAFSCQLACGQDVDAARARLQQLEEQRKQAAKIESAKAEAHLAEQAAAVAAESGDVSGTPAPEPDENFADVPEITFEEPVSSASAAPPYFRLFVADNCGPCKRMQAEGVPAAIEAAGYTCHIQNVTHEPHKEVTAAPQLWLYAGDDTPVRRWIGYRTAADVLKPISVDGLCKLSAKNSKGEGFKRWSGAAIADGLILTCAHHEETKGFFAEFPTQFGKADFVQVRCELVKIDENTDLCLLSFDPLPMLQIKTYKVSDRPPEAVQASGYFEGDKPQRLRVRKKDNRNTVRGIAMDSFIGEGINSPQVGMSGSPMLTPDEQIVGVQVLGLRDEIDAVSLETIRAFLPAESPESSTVATITNATATPDTFAAAVSAHLMRESGQPSPGEPMGSLFTFDVDAPESWLAIARKVVTAQTLDFPRAGLTVDWTGPTRSFSVASDGMRISPPVKVTVNKWLISYTAKLDGISYTPDLTSVTVLLTGAPDLTINLK